MSLNNLASPELDNIYTNSTDGVSGLFDKTNKNSPYQWIKTSSELGITPAPVYDISGNISNLKKYQEYAHAVLDGKSDATKISNNNQPLGNRYFMPSGKQCIDKHSFKQEEQYYVVDGMSQTTNSSDKNGLAYSILNNLSSVDSKNMNKYINTDANGNMVTDGASNSIILNNTMDINDNLCTNVTLHTDGYGNKDTKPISISDYTNLSSSGIVTETFHTHHTHPIISYVYGYGGGVGSDRYSGYLYAPNIIEYIPPIGQMHPVIEEEEIIQPATKQIVLKKDTVTGFFLGSVTVLGLYVIFRFLDKSASSMRR